MVTYFTHLARSSLGSQAAEAYPKIQIQSIRLISENDKKIIKNWSGFRVSKNICCYCFVAQKGQLCKPLTRVFKSIIYIHSLPNKMVHKKLKNSQKMSKLKYCP